jgi:hypothetical protein
MEKIIPIALRVAFVFALSIVSALPALAEAGGCQTLSSSNLEQKAIPYGKPIASAASKFGVSKDLIKAVITIESCFKSTARGSSGEKGLMQLMPGTARRFNIRNGYNAWQNIHGGAQYLGFLLGHYDGNAQRAVAAYNAGEGNVSKAGRIPNKGYVGKVMHAYNKFSDGDDRVYMPQRSPRTAKLTRAVLRMKPETDQVLPWSDLRIAPTSSANTYVVNAGDTVYEVMRQTQVPVPQIIRLNHLPAPFSIKAGQVLRLR